MKRSMSDSNNSSRFGQWYDDDDSNHRPYKKPKTGHVTEDDADSSSKTNTFQNQLVISNNVQDTEWWVLTRFLGKGSYGSVHLAVSTTSGEEASLPSEMAIKTTEFSQASRLKNERKFLQRLKDSPYVVSYYCNVVTQDESTKKMLYNTILEYCSGQCLAKSIKSQRGRGLPEAIVKRFAIDILNGLKDIHEKEIIHCDIKPKNILLVADLSGQRGPDGYLAKISGFGKAMSKGSDEYGEGWGHRRGTTRFMSPELIGDMVLDYGADVWAFGCTVLEMLTGKRVWAEEGALEWEDWISLIGESGAVPRVPESLSEKAKDFLSKCLERDLAKRWTVDRLIKHPFVYDYSVEEEEDGMEEVGDADVEEYDAYLEVEERRRRIRRRGEEEKIGVAYEPYLEEEEAVEDYVEAYEPYLDEEEEEEIGDVYEPYLEEEEEEEEEGEEAIEIDEEYPREDWEEDL